MSLKCSLQLRQRHITYWRINYKSFFKGASAHTMAPNPPQLLKRSEIGGCVFCCVQMQKDSQHCMEPTAAFAVFKERIGSNFAGWVTCWSSLMAILYQCTNPIIAVTDTMKRPSMSQTVTGWYREGLFLGIASEAFLQLNPRPSCMFGFSNHQLLLAEQKGIRRVSALDPGLFDIKLSYRLLPTGYYCVMPQRDSRL